MKLEPDNEQLLTDVMADDINFREALLGETLRLVRRRRWRRTRQAAVSLSILSLVAIFAWQSLSRRPLAPAAGAARNSYQLVQTHPLPAAATVCTQPLADAELVSSSATVETIQTTNGSGDFGVINDDELLALVASRPAGLVRTGPHSERLIFANPDDGKGFPVN